MIPPFPHNVHETHVTLQTPIIGSENWTRYASKVVPQSWSTLQALMLSMRRYVPVHGGEPWGRYSPVLLDQGVAVVTKASSGIGLALLKPKPRDEDGVSTLGILPEWFEGAALAERDPASEVERLEEGELSKVSGFSWWTREPLASFAAPPEV